MKKEERLNQVLSKYFRNNRNITNILGDFEIGKQLGVGGTSVIREATLDGKIYAIKFLHENIADKETTAYKRFKQAYINLKNIRDSKVVLPQLHIDTLKINDDIIIPYTIMPKADMTLKDWHKEVHAKGKMTFEIFEQSFKNIINVVNGIHKDNIIHRDIKPENFFMIDNQLMLGDFDISKFSDESHIHLVETKKGDRLANFAYSAPEQFQQGVKFEDITKSADWFAVGQVLYWLVVGHTLRGQEQIDLKGFDNRYSKYEPIIEKLLQQNPNDRFQSKEEIEQFFIKSDILLHEFSLKEKRFETLRIFDDILEKYSPGIGHHKYKKIDDIKTINEFMIDLTTSIDNLDLWWSQGLFDNRLFYMEKFKYISPIARIKEKIPFFTETKWILGNFEININCIWIFKYGAVGGSSLIIESKAMKSFGIFNNNYKTEEVALFNGIYIPKSHYDSGWTTIKGERIKVDIANCKIRVRNLYKDIFFIAPWASSIIGNNNVRDARSSEEVLDKIYTSYRKNTELNEELLFPLKKLKRKVEICMYD